MAFTGFTRRTRHTPVPDPLLGPLLERIDDLRELRCTLRIIWLLHHKKGHPRLLTESELRSDPTLSRLMGDAPEDRRCSLDRALEAAVLRGTLLVGALRRNGEHVNVYTINTEAHRRAFEERGIVPPHAPENAAGDADDTWAGEAARPNAYTLYEQNIGMLTPARSRRDTQGGGGVPGRVDRGRDQRGGASQRPQLALRRPHTGKMGVSG